MVYGFGDGGPEPVDCLGGGDAAEVVGGAGSAFEEAADAAKFGLQTVSGYMGLSVEGITGEETVWVGAAKTFTFVDMPLPRAEFLVGSPQLDTVADGLLGDNLLSALDTEFDLGNGVIRMFKPQGCQGAVLAYWNSDTWSEMSIEPIDPPSDWIVGHVVVNGVSLRVLFDTGADGSILTLQGAPDAQFAPMTSDLLLRLVAKSPNWATMPAPLPVPVPVPVPELPLPALRTVQILVAVQP